MSENPIEGMMHTTMDEIKKMVDINTIVGDPITTPDGTIIIPVSKVSYGFASGGSEFPSNKLEKELFGGGGGAGISIQPVAFIIISGGETKLLQINPYSNTADRVVDLVPDTIDKLTGLFKKKGSKDSSKGESVEVIKEI